MKSIRLVKNIAGGFLTRAVNLAATAIVVPLAVRSLGTADYGYFAVVLSAATFFAVADFGLGLALVNPVALADSQNQTWKARALISQVWFFLLAVAGVILVGGAGTVLAIHGMGSAGPLSNWSAAETWLLLIVLVAAGLPGGLTQRVLFALDRNYQANLWQTAGRTLVVVGSLIAYFCRLGIHGFILASLALPALVGWVSSAWLYLHSRPDLAPTLTQFSLRAVAENIPSGLRYLLLQMAQFAELGFDVVLVASFLGARQAASFDLVTRLFNYIPGLTAIGILPLWPAIAGAVARGEHAWVTKVESLSLMAVVGISLLPGAALTFAAPYLVHVWTGATVHYPLYLTAVLGITAVLSSIGSLKSSVIMAKDGEKRLFHIQATLLVILVGMKLVFLKKFGLPGLVLVTPILYAPRLLLFERILEEHRAEDVTVPIDHVRDLIGSPVTPESMI